MICLLDMDGVLANFVHGVARLAGVDYQSLLDAKRWDFYTVYGDTWTQFQRRVDEAGPMFWEALDPYPWMDELIGAAEQRFDRSAVYIATCPYPWLAAASGKLAWVKRHLPDGYVARVIEIADKSLLAKPGRVLVDDKTENCEAFRRAGGGAVLWPQPWNQSNVIYRDKVIEMIRHWGEIPASPTVRGSQKE